MASATTIQFCIGKSRPISLTSQFGILLPKGGGYDSKLTQTLRGDGPANVRWGLNPSGSLKSPDLLHVHSVDVGVHVLGTDRSAAEAHSPALCRQLEAGRASKLSAKQKCNPKRSLLTFCGHLGFCRNGLRGRVASENQLRYRRKGTSAHKQNRDHSSDAGGG